MAATAAARWNIPAEFKSVRFEALDPAQGRNAVAQTTFKVANFVLPYLEAMVNTIISYVNTAIRFADQVLNGRVDSNALDTSPSTEDLTAAAAARLSSPSTPAEVTQPGAAEGSREVTLPEPVAAENSEASSEAGEAEEKIPQSPAEPNAAELGAEPDYEEGMLVGGLKWLFGFRQPADE